MQYWHSKKHFESIKYPQIFPINTWSHIFFDSMNLLPEEFVNYKLLFNKSIAIQNLVLDESIRSLTKVYEAIQDADSNSKGKNKCNGQKSHKLIMP